MAKRNGRIVVTLSKNFALLGEPQGAVEGGRRQGEDRPRCGSAAAAERATAAVKERELHAPLLRDAMQLRLHALQIPAGSEVTAVLGAVRITDDSRIFRSFSLPQ